MLKSFPYTSGAIFGTAIVCFAFWAPPAWPSGLLIMLFFVADLYCLSKKS